MKKTCLRITAAALALTMTAGSVSVSASAKTLNREFEISFALREKDTMADTVYIDPADLENGDYVFKTALYLETEEESLEELLHLHASWDAYSENGDVTKYIYTEGITTYTTQWNDDRTNKILKEIEAANVPYVQLGMGDNTIHSAGPNQIYIEDAETHEKAFFPLTVDEKTGVATAVVSYTYGKRTLTEDLTLEHYDPNTPYGDQFLREYRSLDLHCLSGFSNAWINEETGNSEMGCFDVIVDEDTPEGTYYIGFDTNRSNYMSALNWSAFTTNVYLAKVYEPCTEEQLNDPDHVQEYTIEEYNDKAYWLKIVVGRPAEEEAENVPVSGDVTGDHRVDIADATEILQMYAKSAVSAESLIPIQQAANTNADVNSDGVVDISDAAAVLTYYAHYAAGLDPAWEDIIG